MFPQILLLLDWSAGEKETATLTPIFKSAIFEESSIFDPNQGGDSEG